MEQLVTRLDHGEGQRFRAEIGGVDLLGPILPDRAFDGVGLRLMRYRASLIGGAMNVAPGKDKGTVVTCTLTGWRGE